VTRRSSPLGARRRVLARWPMLMHDDTWILTWCAKKSPGSMSAAATVGRSSVSFTHCRAARGPGNGGRGG
jgi:hypothetical protein